MTGLELWTKQQRSSPEEILILMRSENMDPSEILGPSLNTDTPIPTGRATALVGMLTRGRSGDIQIRFANVAAVMDCDLSVITEITGEHERYFCSVVENAGDPGNWTLRSNKLPALILDLKTEITGDPTFRQKASQLLAGADSQDDNNQAAGENQAEDKSTPDAGIAGQEAKTTAKPAAKPQARRKGKYAMTKAAAMEIFRPSGADMPIREIRAFLLSMPGQKSQDVALMSDDDALGAFGKEYVCVGMPGGTLIMPKRSYDMLIGFMGANEISYIPSVQPDNA